MKSKKYGFAGCGLRLISEDDARAKVRGPNLIFMISFFPEKIKKILNENSK